MLHPWPVCPRPLKDESLHSWFERVAVHYKLPDHRLLHAVSRGLPTPQTFGDVFKVGERLRRDPQVAQRIVDVGQLRRTTQSRLWPPLTGWELQRHEFMTYCPQCCLDDMAHGHSPYGRLLWQQAWCTVCDVHRLPLLLRRPRARAYHVWSPRELGADIDRAAATCYRDLKHVPREPWVRYAIVAALIEIQHAVTGAIAGIRPPGQQWGDLDGTAFLQVLTDVTTWALTHFEPVKTWSAAETLTPIERAEGLALLGRHQRLTPSDYPQERSTRALIEIRDPALRGSALWLAHSLMASCHQDASDRVTGVPPQARQRARLAAIDPAGHAWLAQQMRAWPERYRQSRWIAVGATPPSQKLTHAPL